ncbi:MAG: IS66 family insertion sequence element accessory protein TnpB [Bacteroidales bacterium]
MFSLNESGQYYLCNGIVDMRKGIDALYCVICNQMKRDPLSGEIFLFLGRRRDTIKILQWQRGGFVLYIKRLERGTFQLPVYNKVSNSWQMKWTDFVMMIEGIKQNKTTLCRRYSPTK